MLDEMALHNNVKNEVKSEVKVEVKAQNIEGGVVDIMFRGKSKAGNTRVKKETLEGEPIINKK